nr:hypothetical protein [Tanacetum cinerariifolium]
MTLTFAETHNMIAYLTKSDANEGFNQILDFLNESSIKYALTVNPNIYVSCIKQFWTTVAVKTVNDVIRLQALVDKKNVVVTEATIREALRLDDAEGVECLPNEEIFAELAKMGYEKPSTKLTFYKALFSSQWKFLIHTILQCMSSKRTPWNEFSSSMASAVICLSSGDLSTHTTKYTSPALTQKVFANMRRVGKGFSGVETPLFVGMLVEQQFDKEGDAKLHGKEVNAGDTAEEDVTVAHGEVPIADEEPSIPSPTPPQPSHDIPSNSQGRMITEVDANADVVLEDDKEIANEAKEVAEDAKLITEVVTAVSETITAAEGQVPAVTLIAAPTRVAVAPSRRRKGEAKLYKNIDYDKVIDHVNKKAKEDNAVKRYQAIKKKSQTEAQAGKNMMTKEQIEEEESRALKRLKEILAEKAAKRQKLDEDVEELKRHLQIVPNKDDDVYTEATPLARKVPVVDHQIIEMNNKPYYKIIRSDDTHQFFVSFLTFMRNFNREDLKALWSLVKERFSTTKPKNFFDDFLLVTLGAMFEKPDIHAQIWKNQRSVHDRKYPLTRFTLDQMLNAIRLEVEEESEVSLELLSFGVDAAMDLKKKHAKCLMLLVKDLVLSSQVDAVD